MDLLQLSTCLIKHVPKLKNSDRLTRTEFERRYIACPEIHKAELIDKLFHFAESKFGSDRQIRLKKQITVNTYSHIIIEPILAGRLLDDVPPDDIDFVLDLGLVRRGQGGGLVIANPIYKEVIPRELTVTAQNSLPYFQPSWLTPDGQLDLQTLLDAFLGFWRQHGQPLLRTAHYHEIAPHIVLMAFLQRVVNGGGTIDREYAIGSQRMDLLVRYGDVRVALELKVWRDVARDPLTDGLAQLDSYLNGLGLDTG